MCLSLFFFLVSSIDVDDQGVIYSDNRTVLQKATLANSISITIPASVCTITGSTQLKDQPFDACRGSLKEIKFVNGSNLCNLGVLCFQSLHIERIDMSFCDHLKYLSSGCFFKCSKLTYIKFPPNLEEIRDGSCSYIAAQSIKFPKSLLKISDMSSNFGMAFGYSSIQKVEWEEVPSLCYIGDNAFGGSRLSSFRFPINCTHIGKASFSSCPIKSFSVDNGNKAFSSDGKAVMNAEGTKIILYAGSLTDPYTVPEKVTMIGKFAFSSTNVSELFLSSKLTSIEEAAFYNTKFKKIMIPSTCVSLGSSIFTKSSFIENVTFGRKYSSLPSSMFSYCGALKEFWIPSGLAKLPSRFFEGCTELRYVFVPKSVTDIGKMAFALLPKDAKIEFEQGSKINYANDTIFNYNFTQIIAYLGSDDSILIPKKVTHISGNAYYSSQISTIAFEEDSHLEAIEESAFAFNTVLKSISFPSSLQYVMDEAFLGCSHLQNVSFGESLLSIGSRSFEKCCISDLNLPQTLLSIGEKSFKECVIKSISFGSDPQLQEIGSGAFYKTSITSISIPKNCSKIMPTAFQKSGLQSLSFPSDVEFDEIPNSAFSDCPRLEFIDFGGIKTIGSHSFEDCTSISELRLGSSIENISSYAFRRCTALAKISIWEASALKNVEGFAFEGCTSLVTFELHNSHNFETSSERDILFTKGKSQIVLYLPASPRRLLSIDKTVDSIGPYAFHGAKNLIEVEIPDSVLSIGFSAFASCTALERVNIPKNIKSIGNLAFDGCTSLGCESIKFPAEWLDRLQDIGTPEEALEHCPTELFTASVETKFLEVYFCPLIESGFEGG